MTRAEKRYFKLHSGRHLSDGERKYHKLFDAIAAADVYDEAVILERFRTEAFTHRFAITKRRLYETVLDSLDAFHAEHSVDARMGRMLHQVQLLYNKALYDDASKLLHGVAKLARNHDRQPVLMAVLEWERRLAERDNYAHVDQPHLEQLAAKSLALHAEVQELDGLWDLKSTLFMTLYRKGQVRDTRMQEELNTLLADHLTKDPSEALTEKARFLFHHIRSAAAYAKGDLHACKVELEANLALLEAQRERFLHEPNLVLSVLSNLAFVNVALGQFTEAFQHLKAFRNTPGEWDMAETEDLDLKLFSTSYSLELGIHTRMGRIDLALELLPAVERGLQRYGDQLGPVRKAGFLYQLGYVNFLSGRTEEALRWTNRLLDGLRNDDSSDLAAAGRTLYLALLLDADKKDLLVYALRNTERYLQSRDRMHRFEPIYMTLLRTSVRARNITEQRAAFITFRDALLPLANDPLERAVFDQFDAIAWAESHISGRPLAEVYQERATQGKQAA